MAGFRVLIGFNHGCAGGQLGCRHEPGDAIEAGHLTEDEVRNLTEGYVPAVIVAEE